jgi:uncharacterized protein (UPF0332 family)
LLDKAAENVGAARLLQQNDFRNIAASRTYYAMFYVAEALLLEKGMAFSGHAAVVSALGREFAKTGALDPRFHRHLIDAQDLRHSGDYGGGPAVTHDQVEQALQWAEDFIAAAEQYLAAED